MLKENPASVYEQFGTIWGEPCSKEQAQTIADMVKLDGMALVEEKYGFKLNI